MFLPLAQIIMNFQKAQVKILETLTIGFAHMEEIVHWWNIWAWNFGSNLTQWVSDIWNVMCAYDGWRCFIEVDVLMTNGYMIIYLYYIAMKSYVFVCTNIYSQIYFLSVIIMLQLPFLLCILHIYKLCQSLWKLIFQWVKIF